MVDQGKIVEYIDQDSFVCGICLQDKGGRLHLVTGSNREMNLATKRAILISGVTFDLSRPREDLLERIKNADEIRNRLKCQVDVKDLWETGSRGDPGL